MKGKFLLAIDQGTTGSRALLLDSEGRLLSSAYEEFPQYFPAPGRVEHDAAEHGHRGAAHTAPASCHRDRDPRRVAGGDQRGGDEERSDTAWLHGPDCGRSRVVMCSQPEGTSRRERQRSASSS